MPPAPPAPGEIEQIIRDVWPDDLEEQALRIAWRESNYNPRAQNYCCSGLFQIYYEVHAGWLAELGVDIGRRPLRPAHQCHGGVRLVPAFR